MLKASGALVAAGVLVLGGEIGLAMRREFFREGPKDQIRGEFGDSDSPELRFVVMGDSTSVGVGAHPDQSFPWILAEKLGANFRVNLFVVGRSSARAADVAQVQLPQAISLEPDLLLMEIGANDATHLTSINKVTESIERVVAVASKTNTLLVVAGPPNMGTTRAFMEPLRSLSGLSGRRVQRAIESVVMPKGITYIDLAAGTGDLFDRDPQRFYSKDMFHPGPAGYALWAEVMYPAVSKAAHVAQRKRST